MNGQSEQSHLKPLVIRFGALGDMVLITALLRALSKRYGAPCDVLGRGKWCIDVFKHLPFVGDVRSIISRIAPYFVDPVQWEIVRWLRNRPNGPIIIIETDTKCYHLLQRAGLESNSSSLDLIIGLNEHVTEHHARLGGFFDEKTQLILSEYDRSPELRVSEEEKLALEGWLQTIDCDTRPIVLFQPGNRKTMGKLRRSSDIKHWPAERWIAVMKGVLEEMPDAGILIIGYGNDQKLALSMVKQANDTRIRAVADQMNIRRLFALLQRAHSLISVDTGPAHAAAALRCPLVVLFGKTDPRVNRPISAESEVYVVSGPKGAPELDGKQMWAKYHSMDAISPQIVVQEWKQKIFLRNCPVPSESSRK